MTITRSLTRSITRALTRPITQAGGWTPALWFLASEQGVWYDPSDMATMFQDSAGTTPVTAVEQPVGLVLDKRLRLVRGAEMLPNGSFNSGATGWTVSGTDATHIATFADGKLRYQSDTTSPVLGLTDSSVFLTAGKFYEVIVEVSSYVSGALVSDRVVGGQIANKAGTNRSILVGVAGAFNFYRAGANVDLTIDSISIKELPGNHATQATTAQKPTLSARKNKLLATATMATQSVTLTASAHTLSFKGTGTVTLTGASTAGPLVGTGAGNRVSLTFTPTAGSVTFTVSGSVTEAQLEDGSAFTTYQSVVTATNYDTVGFYHYLKFDGVDDSLATAAIDFTATDKMTVVAGVRKLSDAATGLLVELGASGAGANGGLTVTAPPNDGLARFGFGTRGTATQAFLGSDPYIHSARVSYVTSCVFDNSLLTSTLAVKPRINGATAGFSNDGLTGTSAGNYSNSAIYIGRRAGTALPFNGHLYSLTVRGAATADVTPAETFTATKTGITL